VVLVRWRSTQQEALLNVMSIASERHIPLSPGLAGFAELCGGGFRHKVRGLSFLLESGVPLPQALANVPGIMTRPSIVLACVGWNDGALAPALRDAVAAEEVRKQYRTQFVAEIGYLCGILFALECVLGFILYFITPKFEAIFADFGFPLPAATIWVIRLAQWFMGTGFIYALIPLQFALLFYVPFSYFGWVRWEPPLVGHLLWKRDAATILRSLAVSVEGGKPITAGIGLLASFYPRGWVRHRLQRVYRAVTEGVAWHDALRRQGLIRRADAAVLESAERAGNLTWGLRAMADTNDRTLGYRLAALSRALLPAIVVFIGSTVAAVAVAYIYPLVTLIEGLAR
jgi:protein transport protein HofC